MKTLIFDTETSGFLDPKLTPDDPKQGRIIQLACVLLDEEFKPVNSFYSLINPKGLVSINPGAQAVHGITMEKLDQFGVSTACALEVFNQMYYAADVRVAHNIKFDSGMIDLEEILLYGKPSYPWGEFTNICTMREFTPICKLPGGRFGNAFKWPKLQEAHKHCFGAEFEDSHDAMVDVMATSRIFKWAIDNGSIVIPASLTA